jgi:hypothetical protein
MNAAISLITVFGRSLFDSPKPNMIVGSDNSGEFCRAVDWLILASPFSCKSDNGCRYCFRAFAGFDPREVQFIARFELSVSGVVHVEHMNENFFFRFTAADEAIAVFDKDCDRAGHGSVLLVVDNRLRVLCSWLPIPKRDRFERGRVAIVCLTSTHGMLPDVTL